MFNEQSLYNDIVDKWGEHGAHADVFRAMQAELTRLTVAYNGLWDKVNELVETSGEIERLGEYIEELRSDRFEWVKTAQKQEAEIERLRAAGDALAQGVLDELQPFPNDEHIGLWWLTVNWEDARRD